MLTSEVVDLEVVAQNLMSMKRICSPYYYTPNLSAPKYPPRVVLGSTHTTIGMDTSISLGPVQSLEPVIIIEESNSVDGEVSNPENL